MTIAKRGPGRPLDMDLRDRIEAVHREHPTWSQRQVATELGCAWRTVRRTGIVPASKVAPAGVRMVIPAELAAWAMGRGGILAVLEQARKSDPHPDRGSGR